jgi:hypothetical protein
MLRPVEDLLTELETHVAETTPAPAHAFLVSGITRVEIEQLHGKTRWLVNNRLADRECAGRAIEHARAFKYTVFTDYPKKV